MGHVVVNIGIIEITMDKMSKARKMKSTAHSYITTSNTIDDISWYMDSRAINHITNDLNQIWGQIGKLHGKMNIIMGNGNKIEVLQSCNESISSYEKSI